MTKTHIVELKRCPFCNTHELTVKATIAHFYVHCFECEATGPGGRTRKAAADHWNGRHRHTNPAALVANRKSNHHQMKTIEV